jgi:hypothetical protein
MRAEPANENLRRAILDKSAVFTDSGGIAGKQERTELLLVCRPSANYETFVSFLQAARRLQC